MFREMRRKKQLLPREAAEKVLKDGAAGVLAVLGDGDYPYAVPVNYVYEDGKIYFHCAKAGHKLDAVRKHEKVSFCVVAQEQVVPEKFTTLFRSAIAFGKASEVEGQAEKLRAVRLLNRKYAPGLDEAGERAIRQEWDALCVVRIEIEHLTGKEAKELADRRNEKA